MRAISLDMYTSSFVRQGIIRPFRRVCPISCANEQKTNIVDCPLWTSPVKGVLGIMASILVTQHLKATVICSTIAPVQAYDLPMSMPVMNTSAPPSPTCRAAENVGVSWRIHVPVPHPGDDP